MIHKNIKENEFETNQVDGAFAGIHFRYQTQEGEDKEGGRCIEQKTPNSPRNLVEKH